MQSSHVREILVVLNTNVTEGAFGQAFLCLQFISTLETNIRSKLNVIVNVTVDKVTLGSIKVANTVLFTDADSTSAKEGQGSLETVMNSGDVCSIFGDSFGTVTVTNVTATDSKNPSKLLCM